MLPYFVVKFKILDFEASCMPLFVIFVVRNCFFTYKIREL